MGITCEGIYRFADLLQLFSMYIFPLLRCIDHTGRECAVSCFFFKPNLRHTNQNRHSQWVTHVLCRLISSSLVAIQRLVFDARRLRLSPSPPFSFMCSKRLPWLLFRRPPSYGRVKAIFSLAIQKFKVQIFKWSEGMRSRILRTSPRPCT